MNPQTPPPVEDATSSLPVWFVYGTEDKGATLTFAGREPASTRDAAVRKIIGKEGEGVYAAISAAQIRLRHYPSLVRPTVEEVALAPQLDDGDPEGGDEPPAEPGPDTDPS